jgi:hypothetical protein
MPRKTQEDRVRLAAARSGLKLITNRYSLTSTGKKTYCLRPVWDATCVVGTLPDGRFGLVKTTSKGRRRQNVASWLQLDAIERMLPDWRGARPRDRARVSQRRRPDVVATAAFGHNKYAASASQAPYTPL